VLPLHGGGDDLVECRLHAIELAIVIQQKTGRPVQFEPLEPAPGSILAWLERRGGTLNDCAFPSRIYPA
jgi:hypothetical protein